jgi:uncharacterized protein (UPF0276 family)
MDNLPELGVGVVYFPALEPLLKAGSHLIDVLEIEPQPYWIKETTQGECYRLEEQAFQQILRWPQQKLVHGVGNPIGGTLGLDNNQIAPFLESIARLNPPWVSEHLAFLRARGPQGIYNTGFLLPPLQSLETVEVIVQNIRQFKTQLPVPFAFENPVNYLRPMPGELPDGEFLARIAEAADCGILLDMHNLWCNQRNGRQPIRDVLAALPLDRIWEVHLAGGDDFQGYWLDAHSGLVPDQLIDICFEVLPNLPNLKAIVFEIIPDYLKAKSIDENEWLQQLKVLQELWNCRGSKVTVHPQSLNLPRPAECQNSPPAQAWEHALAAYVNGCLPEGKLQQGLTNDPGTAVLQQLIKSVRAGMLVDLLTLSYRLMVLHLGEPKVWAIMETYWSQLLPEPFAAEEALRFTSFVQSLDLPVPHLKEVLAYERASLITLKTGDKTVVEFTCDPMVLLGALSIGQIPERLPLGCYTVTVCP